MNRPSARRTPFPAGFFDIAPILVGVFPFGLIAGIAAVEAGLGSVQAYATSPIVFRRGFATGDDRSDRT